MFYYDIINYASRLFCSSLILLSATLLSGINQCGDDDDDSPTPLPIPPNTDPCTEPDYWPYLLESRNVPLIVHYSENGDQEMAEDVLGYLDYSWIVETEDLKFREPLDDQGLCGPDGRFDVFVWRGINTCYADVVALNTNTSYDDYSSYMIVDPWGDYGGEILDSTLAHELNHASQAADDWWDCPIIFEMTSTLIEDAVFDSDNEYMTILFDFQGHPEWSIDRNDNYVTWYMYGASLYLFYVNDRFFDGDFSFASDMWLQMRNPPGAEYNPKLNEPDFEDALSDILIERAGVSFLETLPEFARWRWYTGNRDDGQHFEEGASYPEDATVASAPLSVNDGWSTPFPAPMMLGNVYLDLSAPIGTQDVELLFEGDENADIRYVVQAVPGLDGTSDGQTLDASQSSWRIQLTSSGTRTVIFTVLPTGNDDPDERTDEVYPFSVQVLP